MKLTRISILFFAVLCLSASAQAAVDWTVGQTVETKTAIRDMVTSFDGKNFFVLTKNNELVMYNAAGKVLGTMKVDSGMDRVFMSGFQKAGVPEQVLVSNTKTGQIQKISFSVVAKIDTTGSPFLGNPEAPVAMVVFSDFQ